MTDSPLRILPGVVTIAHIETKERPRATLHGAFLLQMDAQEWDTKKFALKQINSNKFTLKKQKSVD